MTTNSHKLLTSLLYLVLLGTLSGCMLVEMAGEALNVEAEGTHDAAPLKESSVNGPFDTRWVY